MKPFNMHMLAPFKYYRPCTSSGLLIFRVWDHKSVYAYFSLPHACYVY